VSKGRGETKGRYNMSCASRMGSIVKDEQEQDGAKELNTQEETLDDSDWNTKSKSERQFLTRYDCRDRTILRNYQYQVESEENRRPRVIEPGLTINEEPTRGTDPETGYEIIDFSRCVYGNETPQQVRIILLDYESRRLRKRQLLLKEKAKQKKRDERLLRAKARLERGLVETTMFYYDRLGKYHSISNALATTLTSENRDIMQERMNDEGIPEWRRETIKWALEQGDMIRKCAKDLKTVAEDGATGDKSRDNLAASFNDEVVPRSWNQVLDQWTLNVDEALENARKERLTIRLRSRETALQSAQRKIESLEGTVAIQERFNKSLKERLKQAREDLAAAQKEYWEKTPTCAKPRQKRKRNNPVPNSEGGRGKTAKQASSLQDKAEGSSPTGPRCLPFQCSMCSPACKELAASTSRGEAGWKDWYKRHPNLDMPEEYKAAQEAAKAAHSGDARLEKDMVEATDA
jgi:hypothetical protein